MKKLLFFAAAVAFSAAVFSCKKAEIVTPEPPVISVSGLSDDLTINVKAEGEACSFGYEIANPATGVELNVKADKSWITDIEAKDGKVTFNVTESKENSERTAIVTLSYTGADDVNVTVKQAAYFAPVISVSGISGNPPVISAGAEGGESSFGYSIENPADGVELAASTDADWISGISTADGKVTFTVQENTTFMKRAATITLTYTGAADVTVNVEQDAALKPVITTSQQGPVAAEAAGGEHSFSYEVTNPVDGAELTASADADWISAVSTDAGSVSFTVGKNTTFENRTATITLTYTEAADVKVSVEQAAAPTPVITVAQDGAVAAEAAGGDYSFTYEVENPVDGSELSASTDAEWITAISTADATVTFTVAANETTEARSANITLSYTGAENVTVTVEQAAAPTPVITVAQEGPVAAEAAGGDYSFTYEVENPVDGSELSASADADWISAISTADAKVTFTVAANETTEARSASITLSYTGAENVTVTVEQAAGEAAPTSPWVEVTDIKVVDNFGYEVHAHFKPNAQAVKFYANARMTSVINSSMTAQELYNICLSDIAPQREKRLFGSGEMDGKISLPGLSQQGDWLLVAIAVDAEGNLGEAFKYEFTIK